MIFAYSFKDFRLPLYLDLKKIRRKTKKLTRGMSAANCHIKVSIIINTYLNKMNI
jgi:hypothetical protein